MPILTIALWSGFFFYAKSSRKIKNIQKNCLKLKPDDYKSDYEALIKKKGSSSMEIKRLRVLATECFKTMNSIDPSYLKNIFTSKPNAKVRPSNIEVRYHKTATGVWHKTTSYGDKILTALGLKICNHHQSSIKSETSLIRFEEDINTWFGPKCKYSICRMIDFIYYCLFFMYLLHTFYTMLNLIV